MAIKCKRFNAVLLDIEGTTTSIGFVKDTLFPYVRENVSEYLTIHWNKPDIQDIVEEFIQQNLKEDRDGMPKPVAINRNAPTDELELSMLHYIIWQMDNDLKTTPLKHLQGLIWEEAYESGQVTGHIYADVLEALKLWNTIGKKVYIYSSGSVHAQKLLFRHSIYGDLSCYLNGYFDTRTGPKISSESYRNICKNIKMLPHDVLFLTDVSNEANAAKEAGLQVIIVARPGNVELSEADKASFDLIHSFEELKTVNDLDLVDTFNGSS